MNDILSAFNNISDEYIAEALLYQNKNVKQILRKIIWIAACFMLVSTIAIFTVLNRSNLYTPSVSTPAYHHQVGETVESYYGTVTYVDCTNNTIIFSIQSNQTHEYCFFMPAYLQTDDHTRDSYMAIINFGAGFGGDIKTLTNVLDIYIDGQPTTNLLIPADGNEHEVVIDYSYLVNNGYEIAGSWSLLEFANFDIPKK